jgi:hypothetical protein
MIAAVSYLWKRNEPIIKYLIIYSISIFALFILVPRPAFGYPRYFLTASPALFILIGLFVFEQIGNIRINIKNIIIFAICILMSFAILFIANPQSTFYSSDGLIKATNLLDFLLNISASFPLFLCFIFKKRERVKIAIICLILLSYVYCIYFDFNLTANDPLTKETGIYLKKNTSPDDIIISPKAIGYYSGRRYHVNDNHKPQINFSRSYILQYIFKSFADKEMKDEMFWPGGLFGGLYPPIPSESELGKAKYAVLYYPVKGIFPEKIIGNFYIYKIAE